METRLARVRACMGELDALLIVSRPNIFWLTGFTGTDAALAITREHVRLMVDSRYIVQAQLETSYDVQETSLKWEDMKAFLAENKTASLGFESNVLDYDSAVKLREIFAGVNLMPSGNALRGLRAVKSAIETDKIGKAAKISELVLRSILERGLSGRSEKDVAIEIDYEMKKMGADNPAFETIVASGERSAMPHATPSDKIIGRREPVLIDFGCIFEGYCSDQTLTIHTGAPDEEFKEVYRKVYEAQQRAVLGAFSGMKASDVDGFARKYLDENGLKDCFRHGLGHGVGLEVHEPPSISPKSNDILETGMVITIEPGAYFEGKFGIRIEDCLLVTDSSCKPLTNIVKGAVITTD